MRVVETAGAVSVSGVTSDMIGNPREEKPSLVDVSPRLPALEVLRYFPLMSPPLVTAGWQARNIQSLGFLSLYFRGHGQLYRKVQTVITPNAPNKKLPLKTFFVKSTVIVTTAEEKKNKAV